jgi:hypothetical protein
MYEARNKDRAAAYDDIDELKLPALDSLLEEQSLE